MAADEEASSIPLLLAGEVGVVRLDSLGHNRTWLAGALSSVGISLGDFFKVMTFSAKSVLPICSSAFAIASYVAKDPHLCFQHSSILIGCSSASPFLLMFAISGLGNPMNLASFSHVSSDKENCRRSSSLKVSFMIDFSMS